MVGRFKFQMKLERSLEDEVQILINICFKLTRINMLVLKILVVFTVSSVTGKIIISFEIFFNEV